MVITDLLLKIISCVYVCAELMPEGSINENQTATVE